MRGPDLQQHELFSDKTLEERLSAEHPLRLVLVLVNGILHSMDAEFDRLYSAIRRHSIPPERLMRASLLRIFYTVRGERQLMEQLDFTAGSWGWAWTKRCGTAPPSPTTATDC